MFPVFLGMSIFSDIFCFMFLGGFGRKWFGFVPFGTYRLTEEGVRICCNSNVVIFRMLTV